MSIGVLKDAAPERPIVFLNCWNQENDAGGLLHGHHFIPAGVLGVLSRHALPKLVKKMPFLALSGGGGS
jgi:hypothetical protein